MKITASDARAYFAHPSQRRASKIEPEQLTDNGIEYRALGGVCGLFHLSFWPDVWMAHYGVKPEAWGHAAEPARAILAEFWAEKRPHRIIGWTDENNRAALAFARRLGFVVDGRFPGVVMQGWRP